MGDAAPQRPFEALGRAVATRRTQLGLKRRDLADRADLSYPYISEIENGFKQPSGSALTRIADALQMERSELLSMVEVLEDVVADDAAARGGGPDGRMAVQMLTSPDLTPPLRRPTQPGSWRAATGAPDDESRIKEIIRQELDAWATYRLPDLIRLQLERLVPGLLEQPDE